MEIYLPEEQLSFSRTSRHSKIYQLWIWSSLPKLKICLYRKVINKTIAVLLLWKMGEKNVTKKYTDRFHPTDKRSLNIFRVHQISVNSLLPLSFFHTRALSAFISSFFQMHEYWRSAMHKSCRFTGRREISSPRSFDPIFHIRVVINPRHI